MASGSFSHSWLKEVTSNEQQRPKNRRRKGVYEDVLEERRRQGDLCWAMRSRQIPHFQFGPPPNSKSPKQIREEVLVSERLIYGLREISSETGQPVEQLRLEAAAILDEMAHNLNLFTVRSFGLAIVKTMKQLYRGVFINYHGVQQLRNACQQYPVVLMPMHRSYTDFLLLSLLCFDYDLPLPVIAAAMDFMGMKLIGSILRNCGAFFIRRSFATDRVYWLTFVEYVKKHVRDGLDPVEFFIEGTRSRTNKTLYPKTGMLGAILESWFMCEVPDIYLVPVSISYDRILEEKLYAYELLGIPKPKESTSGLLRARSVLSEDFGSVHFYFDEPISLRKFSDAFGVDRSVHSLMPKVKASLTEQEMKMLKSIAHYVIQRQNMHCQVPAFSLVATLLLCSYSVGSNNSVSSIALTALANDCDWLRHILLSMGASVDWPSDIACRPEDVVLEQVRLHSDLLLLQDNGGGGSRGVYVELIEEAGAGDDNDNLLTLAAQHLRLCSYRNQLIYHLAGAAILVAAAKMAATSAAAAVEARFAQLQQLLHREFVLEAGSVEDNFRRAWQHLLDLGAVSVDHGDLKFKSATAEGGKLLLLLHQLLLPFIQSYLMLIRCLIECRDRIGGLTNERSLAAFVQNWAKRILCQQLHQNRCYESLSLDLLTNAIHGLHHLKLIVKYKHTAKPNYFDWLGLAQLSSLLEKVASYDSANNGVVNADARVKSKL